MASSLKRGMPVLVRNARNGKWVVRAFDKLDGSWMNETRCVTTDGNNWKYWTEYQGHEQYEGTSIPCRQEGLETESIWRPMDVCLYWDSMNKARTGFFVKFDVDSSGKSCALVSRVPFKHFGMQDADLSREAAQQIETVPVDGICRMEIAYPFWNGCLYSEPVDRNPFDSRVVPC